VVLISFELTLGETRGMLNLCIPFNSIERVSNKLQSNNWATYGGKSGGPEVRQKIGSRLDAAVVELTATLAQTTITMKDLIELRVGDIIATEKDIHAPLVLSIQNVPKFHASPGKLKGKKAVEVLGPIDPLKPEEQKKTESTKR
jgi:flagellar motor switch protein FliM